MGIIAHPKMYVYVTIHLYLPYDYHPLYFCIYLILHIVPDIVVNEDAGNSTLCVDPGNSFDMPATVQYVIVPGQAHGMCFCMMKRLFQSTIIRLSSKLFI